MKSRKRNVEMKIAICDDELLIARQLEKIIRHILHEWNMEHEIQIYQSGAELLADIKSIQVVFLEIDMPGMDGVEVGHILRKKGADCDIIIATSMIERYKEAFHIKACRFITKPFCVGEVKEALQYVIDSRIGEHIISVFDKRIVRKIPEKKISYLRAYDGYVELKTTQKVFRRESTLDELYKELDKRLFFRIHRSYIVNFSYITNYKDGIVTIENEQLNVSRRCRKEFEKKWIDFDLFYRK